jgi:hypothetical protein
LYWKKYNFFSLFSDIIKYFYYCAGDGGVSIAFFSKKEITA